MFTRLARFTRTFGRVGPASARDEQARRTRRLKKAGELMDKGQMEKALPLLTELHGESAAGDEHALAQDVAYHLAFCHWVVGDESKAVALAEHGFRTHDDPFGRGNCGRLLGMCHLTSGRTDEGTRVFRESLDLLESARPLDSLTTRLTLDLAALCRDEGRWSEVAALLEKVLTGYQRGDMKHVVDNSDVFGVRWSLAIAYWHEERFDDVREQLVRFRGYEPMFARHSVWQETAGQAGALLNYLELHPRAAASEGTTMEDIVGVVRDDWRYQGLLYKGQRAEGGWGGASGRA